MSQTERGDRQKGFFLRGGGWRLYNKTDDDNNDGFNESSLESITVEGMAMYSKQLHF